MVRKQLCVTMQRKMRDNPNRRVAAIRDLNPIQGYNWWIKHTKSQIQRIDRIIRIAPTKAILYPFGSCCHRFITCLSGEQINSVSSPNDANRCCAPLFLFSLYESDLSIRYTLFSQRLLQKSTLVARLHIDHTTFPLKQINARVCFAKAFSEYTLHNFWKFSRTVNFVPASFTLYLFRPFYFKLFYFYFLFCRIYFSLLYLVPLCD